MVDAVWLYPTGSTSGIVLVEYKLPSIGVGVKGYATKPVFVCVSHAIVTACYDALDAPRPCGSGLHRDKPKLQFLSAHFLGFHHYIMEFIGNEVYCVCIRFRYRCVLPRRTGGVEPGPTNMARPTCDDFADVPHVFRSRPVVSRYP